MSGLDEKGLEAATRVYAKQQGHNPDDCMFGHGSTGPDGAKSECSVTYLEACRPSAAHVVRTYLASATPADVGEEPVAWRWKPNYPAWGWEYATGDNRPKKTEEPELKPYVYEPLYSATALERVVRERDEARRRWKEEDSEACALRVENGRFKTLMAGAAKTLNDTTARAEVAEAELAEARKVIEWIKREAHSWAASYTFASQIEDAARRFLEETK